MKKQTTLVVMAAGMGSRYGGLKQIDPVGPNGEIILDFSVYDAIKAGFDKVVFVIRRDIEKDFKEVIANRLEKKIDVEYVFQDMENIPEGCSVPADRTKPLGTGHVLYCLKDVLKTPFAIINADDYYGQSAFSVIHDKLVADDEMCMVGYMLGNTLTDHGTVARGVCNVKDGYLDTITEHTAIDKNSGIPLDTPVSMNMWGFNEKVFEILDEEFVKFLNNMENPMKDEFLIPHIVDTMIKTGYAKFKVLSSPDKWYGVTYKEDKPMVMEAMKKMVDGGYYNGI